jgi:hypothetical protein
MSDNITRKIAMPATNKLVTADAVKAVHRRAGIRPQDSDVDRILKLGADRDAQQKFLEHPDFEVRRIAREAVAADNAELGKIAAKPDLFKTRRTATKAYNAPKPASRDLQKFASQDMQKFLAAEVTKAVRSALGSLDARIGRLSSLDSRLDALGRRADELPSITKAKRLGPSYVATYKASTADLQKMATDHPDAEVRAGARELLKERQ